MEQRHHYALYLCWQTRMAMSTFSPISSRSSNGMRICVCGGGGWGSGGVGGCGQNVLEVCTMLAYPQIS